jgi:hypothetical protein
VTVAKRRDVLIEQFDLVEARKKPTTWPRRC